MNQIEFAFNYNSGTSISLLESFCRSNLFVYPTLVIQSPNKDLELYRKLNDSPSFDFNKKYLLNFDDYIYCKKTSYTAQDVRDINCEIKTFHVLKSTKFNDVISKLDTGYLQLF